MHLYNESVVEVSASKKIDIVIKLEDLRSEAYECTCTHDDENHEEYCGVYLNDD